MVINITFVQIKDPAEYKMYTQYCAHVGARSHVVMWTVKTTLNQQNVRVAQRPHNIEADGFYRLYYCYLFERSDYIRISQFTLLLLCTILAKYIHMLQNPVKNKESKEKHTPLLPW